MIQTRPKLLEWIWGWIERQNISPLRLAAPMMTSYRKTEKCVLLLAINVHSFCKVFTVMKYALNLTERVNAVSFRPREVFKICKLDLNSTYDESFLNQFVLICIRNVWFFKVLLDVLHNHDELGNFPRHSKILLSRPSRGSLKVKVWARLLAADRETECSGERRKSTYFIFTIVASSG